MRHPAPVTSPATTEPALAVGDRSRELAYTSYLRVLAIVGVVFIHIAGLSFVRKDLHGSPAWWLGAVMNYGSRWAVLVFVMVSGALLLAPPTDQDAGRFYRKRLAKLGVPLLVWHAVYITLSVISWKPQPGPRRLVANLLQGQSYTALYFFWLILGLYAVTPLLWPLVSAWPRRGLAIAGAALAALPALDVVLRSIIAVLREEPRELPDPTLVTQFLPYVGFFLLGYALRDVVVRGVRLLALVGTLVALLVQMVLQATLAPPLSADGDGIVHALLPLNYQGTVVGLSAVAVFVVVRSLVHPGSRLASPSASRRARFLGELTFGVFACHLLVFYILARVPGVDMQKGATTVPGVLALNAAVVGASFAVAWLFSRTAVLRHAV